MNWPARRALAFASMVGEGPPTQDEEDFHTSCGFPFLSPHPLFSPIEVLQWQIVRAWRKQMGKTFADPIFQAKGAQWAFNLNLGQ